MTWILGAGVPFGYGALVSDIRAGWRDGSHLDCLQKIYPVGPWLMAGLCGSVQFGFETLADLHQTFCEAPKGHSYLPTRAAWCWHRRARRKFAVASAEVRDLGCSILLVGVSPLPHQGIPQAYCLRMQAPTFTPEVARPFAWLSIGTGKRFDFARTCSELDLVAFADGIGQSETMNRGGAAFAVGMMASMESRESPLITVSGVFQVGTVWDGEHVIRTVDGREVSAAWSTWGRRESSGLATSWEEFRQKATTAGLSASAAAA